MVTFPIFWIFWMSKFEFEENAAVRWLYVYDRWFEISSRMNDSYVESSIKHDYVPSVVIKFWRVMNKRPGRSRGCLSHRPINSVVAAICWHKNQTLFFLTAFVISPTDAPLLIHCFFHILIARRNWVRALSERILVSIFQKNLRQQIRHSRTNWVDF